MRGIVAKAQTVNAGEVCFIRWIVSVLLFLCTALVMPSATLAEDQISRSVVKIIATNRFPDVFRPWTKQTPREGSASGVIIEGKRILTNAHVVAYAKQIYIQPYQSANKIAAKVIAVAPKIDLALLAVDDEAFFENSPWLPFAENLPRSKDMVNVYGYPMGGSEQSVTEGIVSRIEYQPSFFDGASLLIQIDAALNPGNSGGAAVNEGRMIGLVCSKIITAESIGFLVPIEEIEMFLEDAADGGYEGQSMLHGLLMQTAENDALRKRLKIADKTTGVLVQKVSNIGPDFPLKPWDLITHLGKYDIDNEGRVRIHEDLRPHFTYLVPRIAKNGKVPMSIIRDGRPLKIDVPVGVESQRLIRFKGFNYPRYFIYGPLVFSEVTRLHAEQVLKGKTLPLLLTLGSPIVTRLTDTMAFEGEELVAVLSPMFPHRITKGYDTRAPMGVVSHINDEPVKNLVHLVETLRDSKDEFVCFRFANLRGESLVFRREEIEAATEEILSDNGIRHQYSNDLKEIWEKDD